MEAKEQNMAATIIVRDPEILEESPAFAARVYPFKTCWITWKQVTPSTSSSSNFPPSLVKWP